MQQAILSKLRISEALSTKETRQLYALVLELPRGDLLALLPDLLASKSVLLSLPGKLALVVALQAIPFFAHVSKRVMLEKCHSIRLRCLQPGQSLGEQFHKGGVVVASGLLQLVTQDRVEAGVDRIEPLKNPKARRKVTARSQCSLIFIDAELYSKVQAFNCRAQNLNKLQILKQVPELGWLEEKHLVSVFREVDERTLTFNDWLYMEGDSEDRFYIVVAGSLVLTKKVPPSPTKSYSRRSSMGSRQLGSIEVMTLASREVVGCESFLGLPRQFSARVSSEKAVVKEIGVSQLKERFASVKGLDLFDKLNGLMRSKLDTALAKAGEQLSPFVQDEEQEQRLAPEDQLYFTKSEMLSNRLPMRAFSQPKREEPAQPRDELLRMVQRGQLFEQRTDRQNILIRHLMRKKMNERHEVSRSTTCRNNGNEKIVLLKRLQEGIPYRIKKRNNSFIEELLEKGSKPLEATLRLTVLEGQWRRSRKVYERRSDYRF